MNPSALSRALHANGFVLHAMLVTGNRALEWEEYQRGWDATRLHHCASITKSFTAMLLGIMIGNRLINSVDETATCFLPEAAGLSGPAPTLRHLLTMTAHGFCPGVPKPDLEPIPHAPSVWGSRFHYSDHQANLLARCLDYAGGGKLALIARQQLMQPLGIEHYDWWNDEGGCPLGGYGLHLNARDLVKLGQLILDEGLAQGVHVVDSAWIREATTPQRAGGPPLNLAYGWYWWIAQLPMMQVRIAAGIGGQRIYVIPERKLVVVLLADAQAGGRPDPVVLNWLETIF